MQRREKKKLQGYVMTGSNNPRCTFYGKTFLLSVFFPLAFWLIRLSNIRWWMLRKKIVPDFHFSEKENDEKKKKKLKFLHAIIYNV